MSATVERISVPIKGLRSDDPSDGDLPMPLELLIDDPEIIRTGRVPGGRRAQPIRDRSDEDRRTGVASRGRPSECRPLPPRRRPVDRRPAKDARPAQVTVHEQIENKLKEYFDPKTAASPTACSDSSPTTASCHTHQRICRWRELAICPNVGDPRGTRQRIMKMLDPQQSDGLLTTLRKTVDDQLTQQRDHLLKEFSLDNKEVHTRLLCELTSNHGDLGKDAADENRSVIKEFSLNEENSALSRLVQNVTQAQRTITNEFSLDNDTSCLSKLKRELIELLAFRRKRNSTSKKR